MTDIKRPRKKAKTRKELRQTAVRLDPQIVDRLNAYCNNHQLRPPRDRIIDLALQRYLDSEDAGAPHA